LEAEMNKTSQPYNNFASLGNSINWSIGSGRLTAEGEEELLRFLGSTMRDEYEQIIEEPVPDHLQSLVDRLDHPTSQMGGKDG
jgi:hypothetical protein